MNIVLGCQRFPIELEGITRVEPGLFYEASNVAHSSHSVGIRFLRPGRATRPASGGAVSLRAHRRADHSTV